MSQDLSPPKIVLLAAHFTASGDIASLASLAARHGDVLRKELLLRLLLSYLPTHLTTAEYVPLLKSIDAGDYTNLAPLPETVDTSSVQSLTDEQAAKRIRKLRLRQLVALSNGGHGNKEDASANGNSSSPAPPHEDPDLFASFLVQRAYAVDEGAGALPQLPDLIVPFLERPSSSSSYLRTWTISTLLPLIRRNCVYYSDRPLAQSLADFEHLPDRLAISRLLSETGVREDDHPAFVGRDLRGLVGPWVNNERRWPGRKSGSNKKPGISSTKRITRSKAAAAVKAAVAGHSQDENSNGSPIFPDLCPGWEEVFQWLTTQARGKSWKVAIHGIQQWNGPGDVDLGGYSPLELDADEELYLKRRYARAALSCAYLVPESSAEALIDAQSAVSKAETVLGQDPAPALQTAATLLSPVSAVLGRSSVDDTLLSKNATYLRNDLLDESNPLTTPSPVTTELLHALILSAFLLSHFGSPCTVRRAGELAMLRNERDQKAEVSKAIHWIASNGPKGEDKYWIKARNEILWLRDWGADEVTGSSKTPQVGSGIFGQVKKDFIEAEFLKALLSNTRYSLARKLYEDSPELPLSKKLVQDTVYAAAMNAYDNASNPNRTRGGLKKCDDIIRAFPLTMDKSVPATRRVEALLTATHRLSDYRLVLKQGEPFTPVVLRVHPDPIAIVSKVLEQNPKSYVNIQDLVHMATSMVAAGLTVRDKAGHTTLTPEQEPAQRNMAERRVTAMCIDAALAEDDFETAYSYVVGRLAAIAEPNNGYASSNNRPSLSNALHGQLVLTDNWSWRAALEAGKYRRTDRTIRPTHLGTASANLEIRHLEQRMECLATALRIAPSDTLQEILNAYRRCEEELEVAVQAEAEQENAWNDAADRVWPQGTQSMSSSTHSQHQRMASSGSMPGSFDFAASHNQPAHHPSQMASRVAAAAAAASNSSSTYRGQNFYDQGPSSSSSAAAAAGGDDAPLSLFDLSRATARAAQRNFTALSSLRQTRQLGFGGGGGANGGEPRTSEDSAAGDSDYQGRNNARTSYQQQRKRDQLRDAAMGTLTSGVGWLIGAQPTDRNAGSE